MVCIPWTIDVQTCLLIMQVKARQATTIWRMITTTLELAMSETVMVSLVEDWAGVCAVIIFLYVYNWHANPLDLILNSRQIL